jgi:hypothetical protein
MQEGVKRDVQIAQERYGVFLPAGNGKARKRGFQTLVCEWSGISGYVYCN